MAGLIGPDGVGKSSLLALASGARRLQSGEIKILGTNVARAADRRALWQRVAYMPQGLGKNLYPTLSVYDNVNFFARLFDQSTQEREWRIAALLKATQLAAFRDRPAGKLSGGMKQKLGLCCALIHDPDLLILDEPTTGVDPLSRRQFWDLLDSIRQVRVGLSVVVATAYMEEADRFDWLAAMDAGKVLATGAPDELRALTRTESLEQTFVALLPEAKRRDRQPAEVPTHSAKHDGDVVIEARGLSRRFGDFVAVDAVSFEIRRGEIFGFIGSNGCGKTTTMKILTGLLPASEGTARLFGQPLNARDMQVRSRVGYMSQSFSLYGELSVEQNLSLHARLFNVPSAEIDARVEELIARFDLHAARNQMPPELPLGQRQRLSLAVALIHRPEVLILDEPTSGVDPVARDQFWSHLVELARGSGVTIFISTHFMNEAARCDRLALMHAGRVLTVDHPKAICEARDTDSLEQAFVDHLLEVTDEAEVAGKDEIEAAVTERGAHEERASASSTGQRRWFSGRRLLAYSRREALELVRDPIRMTLALVGTVILMLVMAYGITLDVEDLSFAVLDLDQTGLSRDYRLNLSGSRYFSEHEPVSSYAELDARMQNGELSLVIEIPPGFARDIKHGRPTAVGAWFDGSMPTRGETILGYVQGMHRQWLATQAAQVSTAPRSPPAAAIEVRYRYNPNVESLVAMVPAVIPLLLMLIPAMLAALSVVREKELGSIINFYVTPVKKIEFVLGKQLPYVVLAMGNFALLTLLAVTLFGVPMKGSLLALSVGALLYVVCATGLGLLISTFMRSQTAALFGTAVLTLLPAVQFSGMIDPVSSLEGAGRWIGLVYPTTHFLAIARGTFSKALGFAELQSAFLALAIAGPVLIALTVALLSKQER